MSRNESSAIQHESFIGSVCKTSGQSQHLADVVPRVATERKMHDVHVRLFKMNFLVRKKRQ